MVKFSKQLDQQLVSEWRAAYVNYKALKKDLKHMKQVLEDQRSSKVSPSPRVGNVLPSPQVSNVMPSPRVSNTMPSPRLGNVMSSPRVGIALPSPRVGKEVDRSSMNLYSMQDSFVALTGHAWGAHRLTRRRSQIAKDPVVQVKQVESDPSETIYETDLGNLHSELDRAFFVRLDSQFNKVNKFYRTKEKDFISQADLLEKQMSALVEMRKVFAEQQRFQDSRAASSRSDDDIEAGRDKSGSTKGGVAGALDRDDLERESSKVTVSADAPSGKRGNENPPSALQMTMRLKVPNTTPSTFWEDVVIRGSSNSEDKDEKASDPVMITKKKLQQAEKLLRAAFIEYYRGLGLLKSYSTLNVVAFAKILKKFDKVSGQRVAAAYLKAVETSYFNTSNKIVKLIDRVEVLFTEQFASHNRRKAMMFLRPAQKRDSHHVTFALDFFLGDQLTSQVMMLTNMEYVICYYLGGFFVTGSYQKCTHSNTYIIFTYVISLLPYWWRLMQCVRRYIDEADIHQIYNALKYFSALVAVATRIEYGHNSSKFWLAMAIIASAVATCYQVYWDLVVDWGLLRRDSKNKWLRDELIMPSKKYVYFLSMGVNVVLRMAWLQSVTMFHFSGMNRQVSNFLFAALEVVRRGHWNFYRLENEHLNNVGKYRATKAVPLPFEDPTTEDE